MAMNYLIMGVQVVVSILLTVIVLLQSKGSGLGQAFGSQAAFTHTRRGAEKLFFQTTIILGFLYILISVVNIILG